MARKDKIGRRMAYALRHNPTVFGLQMDKEGWIDLQSFMSATGITHEDLQRELENPEKKRFEVRAGMIRAFYGHSGPHKVEREEETPPDILFHGTTPFAAFRILKGDGITPMGRQNVHLTTDRKTAYATGRRRNPNPKILRIDAKGATAAGVRFYRGNQDVWLADHVPAEWVSRD